MGGLKGATKENLKNFETNASSLGGQLALKVASGAIDVVEDLALGDKNFGSQSEAIDSAVDATSGALIATGNPYCQIAGAALKGVNFLSKAGGQTVQGFDVDINSSGYGQMGHMESSSSRSFFGLNNRNI
jgi:hypothetical protein